MAWSVVRHWGLMIAGRRGGWRSFQPFEKALCGRCAKRSGDCR